MNRETKSFIMQVKATDDDQGLIEAYGSVFDYRDQGGDVVKPGAFKRTIQNSKSRVSDGKAKFLIPMLWQHNEKCPIGGWYELKEDDKGLKCKGQIILTTQLGREAYELIKAGVVNEFSIGYDIPKGGANYDKATGDRNLTEVRLWEISPVTFAMNDESLLVGVKGTTPGEQKDFAEDYRTATAYDAFQDWDSILLRALTSAMCEAVAGESPEADLQVSLSQFQDTVLNTWLPQALQSGIQELFMPYKDHYDSMSAQRELARKAGRSISASNAQMIQEHCENVKGIADTMKKSINDLHKAMHGAANDLAARIAGPEGDDDDNEEQEQKPDSKAAISPLAHSETRPSGEDTANEEDAAAALLALLTTP